MPNQRRIARKYYSTISMTELEELLENEFHEHRLTAIFMLVLKYEKARVDEERKALVDFYLSHLGAVNNWDLVDSSAYKILGPYLEDRDRGLLYELARSGDLWKQRIAVIASYHFIKKGDYNDTLKLADLLLCHEHDLIHKAVGWMLREVGNRSFKTEYEFLKSRYEKMPRTMLRYAIEKFDPPLRKKFLTGEL